MSKNMNVPKLRFSEFGGDWEEKKLGDIGKVSMCKRIMKDETTLVGEIPFYKIGTFGKEADAYIDKELYENYKNKYSFPKKGDILISASGTIGRTVVYNGLPAYFQDSNIVWIDNNDNLVKNFFLLYCYENTKWNTEDTTIARLYNENLRNVKIIIPLKKEQEKIASFLSSIDTKIEQLTKKESLLQEYKKGVMQKIFNQEIRFKADDGSEFCDWEEKKLDNIAKFSKGKGISKSDIVENGNLECIRYGELYTKYKETITDIYSKTNLDKKDLILSEYGDVIIPASGETQIDIATASCVLKDNIALSGDLNIIKTKEDGVFLSYYLNNKKKLDIAKLSQGISVVHLYSSQLKLLILNLPCLKEQTKIANFLSSIDKKIESTKKELEKTKEFKKALLQQMFV